MDYRTVPPYVERRLDRYKLIVLSTLFVVLLLGALFWHLL